MVPCFTTSSTVMLDIFPTTVSTGIRSSRPELFLRKGVQKKCSKFTGGHPCRSVISIKLQSNFLEITLRHGCSPVHLAHIFRTPFPKNTSVGLPLSCYLFIIYLQFAEDKISHSHRKKLIQNFVNLKHNVKIILIQFQINSLKSNSKIFITKVPLIH